MTDESEAASENCDSDGEYSYHDSDGSDCEAIQPAYDEADALAAALHETEWDDLARQLARSEAEALAERHRAENSERLKMEQQEKKKRMARIRERQRNELALAERNRREMSERETESSNMSYEDKGSLLKKVIDCVGFVFDLGVRNRNPNSLAYVTNGGTEVLEDILTGATASDRPKWLACLFTRPESDRCVALNRYLAGIAQQNRETLFCTFDATKVCNKILADAAGNVQIPTLWLVKDGKVTRRMRGLAELGGDQSSWKTVATELQIHGLIKGSVLGSGLYTTTSDLYFLLLRLSQPPLRSDFNRVAGWGGKILRHIVEFIGPAWRGARSYQGGRRRRR